MRLVRSIVLCCGILGVTCGPVSAQSTFPEWYDSAETLRKTAPDAGALQHARDIHTRLIQAGYDRSLVPLAEIYLEQGDISAAKLLFERAAKDGNLYAITRIAQAHTAGDFGDESRPEDGVELLRKLAANPENRRAITTLAKILFKGEIVPANPVEALELYKMLPEDATAQRQMAELYISGALGEVDVDAAINAYQMAISLGSTALRPSLAEAYLLNDNFQSALSTLEAAVADGDERALLRLVRWHRDGTLGPLSDPGKGATALDDLTASGLIDADQAHSFRASLAEQFLETGAFAEALQTLAPAVAEGHPKSLYRFMRWHLDDAFGPLSDPGAGLQALRVLTDAGHVDAAIFASYRLDNPLFASVADREKVFDVLAQAADEGDGAATRALLRAYRTADIRNAHRAVIARYADQVSMDDRVLELVYADYDSSNHRSSRERALDILQTVDGDAYTKGMMQLRSLERTSYVYVLQADLEFLGYYSGPRNGTLTSRTISAILDFCRDAGLIDDCRSGPISKENSRLIVNALQRRKAAAS